MSITTETMSCTMSNASYTTNTMSVTVNDEHIDYPPIIDRGVMEKPIREVINLTPEIYEKLEEQNIFRVYQIIGIFICQGLVNNYHLGTLLCSAFTLLVLNLFHCIPSFLS